jgi:hypothetical protein
MSDVDKIIDEAKKDVLPYESWQRLSGESPDAFAAFCTFRDFGFERNIRNVVESVLVKSGGEINEAIIMKKYRGWRNWSSKYRWRERAADFDNYREKLKATELRKTIEAQGEKHREVTGKMLDVVSKKLDLMNPEDLSQSAVTEWTQVAIKADREAAGLVASCGSTESKKEGIQFSLDFQGL